MQFFAGTYVIATQSLGSPDASKTTPCGSDVKSRHGFGALIPKPQKATCMANYSEGVAQPATTKKGNAMSDFASRTTESGVVVVQPMGRLNMVAASTLRKQLSGIVDGGSSRIVVDLSATEFIDSSGLGALIAGLKIARQAGGDLCISAPTRQVCTVLELSNLDRVLRTCDSVDRAFDV